MFSKETSFERSFFRLHASAQKASELKCAVANGKIDARRYESYCQMRVNEMRVNDEYLLRVSQTFPRLGT